MTVATGTTEETDLDQIWRQYKASGSIADRNLVVEHYIGFLRWIASQGPHWEFDDRMSFGAVGLIAAVEDFDPGRGLKFESFAGARVRGAILDGQRKSRWVPDKVARRGRADARVISILEGKLGRSPTAEEVARELEITVDELRFARAVLATETPLSLSDAMFRTSSIADRREDRIAGHGPTPENVMEVTEVLDRLAAAVDGLPQRTRAVLALRYQHRLELKQVGDALGLGTTRASQLCTEALDALVSALAS